MTAGGRTTWWALGCAAALGAAPALAADAPAPANKTETAQALPAPPGAKVQVVRERYANRAIKIERHVTQDASFNFVNHGPWSMWDPKGNLLAKGEYALGKRQGEWTRWFFGGEKEETVSMVGAEEALSGTDFAGFRAPITSKAAFADDKVAGAWTVTDADGRSLFAVDLDRDVPHGKAVWWYANGKKRREIEFNHGVVNGHWQEWESTGAPTREDRFIDGCRLAEVTTTYESGAKSAEGVYLFAKENVKVDVDWWTGLMDVDATEGEGKALKQGKWTFWYQDGEKRYDAEYLDDKPVGLHVWWHPNGQKECEGRYESGQPVAMWVYWHDNGLQSAQGEFQAGKKIGRWMRWNTEGKVIENTDHTAHNAHPTTRPMAAPPVMQNHRPQTMPAQQSRRPYGPSAMATPTPASKTGLVVPAGKQSPSPQATPAPSPPQAACKECNMPR